MIQSTGGSLFQSASHAPPLTPNILVNARAIIADRRRAQSIAEALAAARKPITDFDEGGEFSLSSVPFIDEAPACQAAELVDWVCAETGGRREGVFSDWPHDLCGTLNK